MFSKGPRTGTLNLYCNSRLLLFRQVNLPSPRNPDWACVFQTPKIKEEPAGLLGKDLLGRRHPGQVVKYLQPRARALPALPRRALGSRLQNPRGSLRWAQLPAPGRGLLGRAGGGGGSEAGALQPSAGVHGSEPAGPLPTPLQDGCGRHWDSWRVSDCDSEEPRQRF